ncbi:MAG: type II toxin-antitoxin system VapB family antitoxin [Micrococcales bacterium]|nr:type II toxin-antitoxin system VapB family antitoxin [Micrococcales bacterium]
MGLNIKNERVHELARRAAAVTGKSQTGAIEEALERLLAEHGHDPVAAQAQARVDRAQQIVADYAALPAQRRRQIRRAEDLYDDATGMPR